MFKDQQVSCMCNTVNATTFVQAIKTAFILVPCITAWAPQCVECKGLVIKLNVLVLLTLAIRKVHCESGKFT